MTTDNDILHPRNELSQFTEKVPGAPETAVHLPLPEAPSTARVALTAAYRKQSEAKQAVIVASGKLAAEHVLGRFPEAVYLDFDASDQGEGSGLWAVDITGADEESVGEADDLYDELAGPLQNLPQEDVYFRSESGDLEPHFTDWLDQDNTRINLRVAADLRTDGSAQEALDAANVRYSRAIQTVIAASGKLTAETILAEYENAAYLTYDCSDQGENSGLWAIQIADADGNLAGDVDDFADDVVEALQNLPQEPVYFTDESGELAPRFMEWLDQDAERIDLRVASRIVLV